MSGWILLHPVGLLALASLAAVGVIYLFHKRHRRRVVSGLFLFEPRAVWQKSGRNLTRPRTSRSLLLDILACLLLSLALAGPAHRTSFGSSLVIVLDGSLSMRAGGNHRKARKQALALIDAHGAPGDVTVIEAGRTPRMTATPGATAGEYRQAVRRYDPFSPGERLAEALSLARESAPGRGTVHLFTDQRPELKPIPGTAVVVHSLKGAVGNLALVDLLRKRDFRGPGDRLILAATNFNGEGATARLVAAAGTSTLVDEPLRLGPRETYRGTFVLPEGTGPVAVTLEGSAEQDRLREDSRAVILPPPDASVTYGIARGVRDREPLERALRAAGALPAEGDPPHLLVTDSPAAEGKVTTLEIPPATGAEDGFVGPFVVDRAHPLCREVDLLGVYWVPSQSRSGESPPATLIAVGDLPLYSQTDGGRLRLNLDLSSSNLARSPAWPVMMAGIVDRTRERLPGLRRTTYRSGEALRFVTSAMDGRLSRRLRGQGIDLPWTTPRTPPRLPERPGVYDLLQWGEPFASVAVNPIAPKESDLSSSASKDEVTTIGDSAPGRDDAGERPVAWILVLAAVLLLGANWFLTGREGGR